MIRILLITLLVATAPVRLFADDTGLYTGAVVVASQGAAERREALPRALAHVLRKLSGARDLEAVPGIEDALQGASALLVSFYYQTVEHPMPDGAVREELRLLARFAEPGVDDLVRQLRLPLWPPQRRPAEVWLVIDDGDGRRVLPAEFDYLRFAVDDAAGLRGAADYEACLAWLQALSIVERVSVRAAAPAQVTFRLDLTAMPRYLEDAIANGRLLEYDADELPRLRLMEKAS